MARPTKLTADLHYKIVTAIEKGAYPETAAEAFGVSPRTYYEWMQRGRGEGSRRPTAALIAFAIAVDGAVARSELRLVFRMSEYIEGTRPSKRDPKKRVKSGIRMGQVQAMQWQLARRFPDRWGQGTRIAAPTEGAEESELLQGTTEPFIVEVVLDRDGEAARDALEAEGIDLSRDAARAREPGERVVALNVPPTVEGGRALHRQLVAQGRKAKPLHRPRTRGEGDVSEPEAAALRGGR